MALERIVAAAICYDGVIFSMASPARHPHVQRAVREMLKVGNLVHGMDQGFTTSTGRYVGRVEAYQIAKEAGQLKDGVGRPPHLFSEDVW